MRNNFQVVKWALFVTGLCGLWTGTAWGATFTNQYNYEMDVAPDDASLGAAAMTKVGGGFGDPNFDFDDDNSALGEGTNLNGPAGLYVAGHSLDGPGTARFIDSGGSTTTPHAGAGFYKTGLGNVFTVDMRVKANWSITPNNNSITGGTPATAGGTSMGITNGNSEGVANSGPGVEIRLSSVNSKAIELAGWTGSAETRVSYATNTGSGGTWTGLQNWHNIRFSINDKVLTVYDLDVDLDPGPDVNYAVIGRYDTGAAAIRDAGLINAVSGTTGGGAFLIGNADSTSNGARTLTMDFSLDWVRIGTGAAAGATDPMLTPEPAGLGLLALGMIGLVWRRRKA